MNRQRMDLLHDIFHRLYETFGPQHWWPADSPFEVVIGAILTQNTAWKNVRQAIGKLRERDLLQLDHLDAVPQEELATLIRASGYYNQKARKLKAFCSHVKHFWQSDLAAFLAQEAESLREELLGIFGIGQETADSIVLYAAHKPCFVVDAYTHRIFSRHGWVPEEITYQEMRSYFEEALERDVALFKEYHALLVRTGHLYCRKKPLCDSCPLGDYPVPNI
ncbi:MAG: endonuclease III domain-containing protein [Deltaproteobacteria bacterium]|nr:endonuclease III domain-containing protein [Deltaproteobacteria bacterium]